MPILLLHSVERFPQKNSGVVGVHDIIIHAKFGFNIFRGFRSTGDQNFQFPIHFAYHRYNSAAATAQPVMIGYWHHHVVRPSVCLSVCAAVPYSSQGCCTGLNLYQRVPSRQVPIFVPSGILYSCCDLHFLSMSQRVWFIYRLVTSSTGSFFVSATTIIWPLPLYLTT